ncbi:MAG TPA: biotin carboxylase N-terminal domain-containing protein [Ilumatobacter sp.]
MTAASVPPFSRVLVANRGEIAVRVIRTLHSLGIGSVAVYSDADAAARHVADADVAVRLGPASASESYLDVDRVIAAALSTGAEAIHPGYGFLSENPALARACAANGIVFVGPPVAAIEAMGDKISAKRTVSAAGVRVVPGRDEAGLDDDAIVGAALEIGLPVLLKPSAGGGGKGMRLVRDEAELRPQLESARREARNAFGDDTILVERFVVNPRHVEIQILADAHGNVVHLGERECSLQRRHQKIVEETPSPFVTPAVRAMMGAQAIDAARACGYTGAGTVEFIMSGDRPDEFFFMEMNTRLQVEHPVTEMTYGVDLVELQLRVAAGEPLPFTQAELSTNGHAIEARIYAEDPSRGFLPTGGTILQLLEPTGPGVRVDSGLLPGTVVGSDYDPMLAKVIAHGADRDEALRRLDAALASIEVLGVITNVAFLRRLLADDDVRAGRLDTGLVERRGDTLVENPVPDAALAVAAVMALIGDAAADDPWQAEVGWRHGGRSWVRRLVDVAGRATVAVSVRRGPGSHWNATIGDRVDQVADIAAPHIATVVIDDGAGPARVTLDGVTTPLAVSRHGATTWVGTAGSAWPIHDHDPGADRLRPDAGATGLGPIRSPMPGTVIALLVAEGDDVAVGQTVAIVEAMKMEHMLVASAAGVVATVHAREGQPVRLDEPVVTIAAAEHEHEHEHEHEQDNGAATPGAADEEEAP